MDVQQYLADIGGIDTDTLLVEWRWLLGDRTWTVFQATAMGDMIVRDAGGRFHLLDMVDGKLQPLADSEPELWTTLGDRSARKTYLLTFVVRDLRAAGMPLGPGECYSPDIPPVLGGALDRSNLRPCSLITHASILGQIHRQLRDLPPGTRIAEVRVVGDREVRLITGGADA